MNKAGNLDLITDMFMMLIDAIRNRFEQGVRKEHLYYPVGNRSLYITSAEIIVDIEKGEYFYNGEREFLKIEDDFLHLV